MKNLTCFMIYILILLKKNYNDLLLHIQNIYEQNKNSIFIKTIYKMDINVNNKSNLNNYLKLKKILDI